MTTTHSSFQIEMEEILAEIEVLSANLFIERYVKKPDVSVIKLQLLNIFLTHARVSKPLRKLYCVTAGLIQLGLDLHENITNHKEFTEKGVRNRQLSILAGDYFSSKYYFLLSKESSIDAVKKLAYGIRNINIVKMKLYTKNDGQGYDSHEQLIDLLKKRESTLYTQFLDKISSDNLQDAWQIIIEETILLFTLNDEIQATHVKKSHLTYFLVNHYANNDEQKDIKDAITLSEENNKLKQLSHKYDLKRKIEDIMLSIYDNLNFKIKGLEDRLIQGELFYLLNQFSNNNQLLKAVEKI